MSKKGGKIRETASQKASKDIAIEQSLEYFNKFVPQIENVMIREIMDFGPEYSRAVGQANADVAASFNDTKQKVISGSDQQTLGGGLSRVAIDEATSSAVNTAGAGDVVEKNYAEAMDRLLSFGRGQADAAVQGMDRDAALDGARATADAADSLGRWRTRQQLIQGAAQLGAGIYSNMNKSGPPPVNEDGIQGVDQGNGITSFAYPDGL